MSVSKVLNAAADLLEKPGAWTQGTYARNSAGDGLDEVEGEEFEPVCFCILGAINTARGAPIVSSVSGVLLEALYVNLGRGNVADWNDAPERTQAEVVQALRQAAEAA